MIPYCLHVTLLLTVCLLFYKSILQRQTYYQLNRVFLLLCLGVSFILPIVKVPQAYTFGLIPQEKNLELTPSMPIENIQQYDGNEELKESNTLKTAPIQSEGRSIKMFLFIWAWRIYWFGAFLMGFNLLIQVVSMARQYYKNPFIKDGIFRIVEINGDQAPCSFANIIFINPEKYDWETYSQILLHEKIHVVQAHTLDIILTELALIFQWYNPMAWYYRKTVENNLEFLTDDQVLRNPEVVKENYQMSLVKVSAPHYALTLTTNYNQSLLKKRVLMMGAKRSNMHTLWKYGMLCPLIAFMFCAINEPVAGSTIFHSAKSSYPIPDIVFSGRNKSRLSSPKLPNNFAASDTGKKSTKVKNGNIVSQSDQFKESSDTLLFLKNQGISSDFMKSFLDVGFKPTSYKDWLTLKQYKIVPLEVKQFRELGYDRISAVDLSTLKELQITPGFIKSFQEIGYPHSPIADFYVFKVRKITTQFIKGFNDLGFPSISFQDLISYKSIGLTPEFVSEKKKEGYHYNEVKKYIPLMSFTRKLIKDSTYQVLLLSDDKSQ